MKNKDVLKDIKDIRAMMERGSRFTAINGWGVVAVGVMAIVAAWVAASLFGQEGAGWLATLYGNTSLLWARKTQVAVCGSLALVAVCGSTVFFSSMAMARRRNMPFAFDATMRRLVFNFSVPLLAGGILCLALVLQGHYGLTSSIMLIFYGLALINCHHFSQPVLGWLGYAELALGLADCFVATHALLFWGVGFGLLHIVLGIYLIVNDRRS